MASGLTTTYLLPYPLQTDPVDVAADVESLAEAVETELLLKSPLASPNFTGTPTAPTAGSDTSTTQIATTQFVVNQGYLKSSLASSTYAPIDSANLTGTPTSTTAPLGDSSTRIATTAFVSNELDNFVTLPSQTGANGFFLTSDGTNASWTQIQQTDVAGLVDEFSSLQSVYAPVVFNVQTRSTTPSLQLIDLNRLFVFTNTSNISVQIPADSSVNFTIGSSIAFARTNAGVSFSGASGVTVLATPGVNLRAAGSFATAVKYAANSWIIAGDLI